MYQTDSQELTSPMLDLFEQGPRVAGEAYAEDAIHPASLIPMRSRGNQFGIAGLYRTEDIADNRQEV